MARAVSNADFPDDFINPLSLSQDREDSPSLFLLISLFKLGPARRVDPVT